MMARMCSGVLPQQPPTIFTPSATYLRAKAAIYAGYHVLAASVGLDLSEVEQVLVGGAFGKYINVENAVTIGLLPDLSWDRFHFLGNQTSSCSCAMLFWVHPLEGYALQLVE